jgi:hypothetical protein
MKAALPGAAVLLASWPAGAAAAVPVAPAAAPLHVEVTNTLAWARRDEVLSLSLAEVLRRRPAWRSRRLAVRVAGRAGSLPVQRYASDGGAAPDRLLVLLDLAPRASAKLEISPAPTAEPPPPNPLHARRVPERDDDFAWENAQVAFRIYGTALEATGQVFPGIDVWSKRPPRHVIDAWYRRDAEGLRLNDPSMSYHVDHGDGLDSYAVGRTPGDGGTAAWLDGAPVYSRNASRVRVTAMGPVRLRFEVDYAPWRVGRAMVSEHKVVTLDAGAHLNRQAVTYRIEGAHRLTVGAGVAVHAGARVAHEGAAQIAVWDTPQKRDAGRIATALLVPPDERARYVVAAGAAWVLFDVVDGETLRFASGAGWSKGDVPDFRAWRRELRDARLRWSHPLRVRWP